jgi:hypothetical protein
MPKMFLLLAVASVVSGISFPYGVGSGDPISNSVILWTRLGEDSTGSIVVNYEVACDDQFNSIADFGTYTTNADIGYSVHIDSQNLTPDTKYYYRFYVGSVISPTGKTRTTPLPSVTPAQFRFAATTCQVDDRCACEVVGECFFCPRGISGEVTLLLANAQCKISAYLCVKLRLVNLGLPRRILRRLQRYRGV